MLKKLKDILENEFDPAFEKRVKFIFKTVEKYKPKKILDAGCGRGFYLKVLSFYSFPKEIHGIDINNHYLNVARQICNDKRVIIKQANIYSLPYPKNYFDLVIASEILEHLNDDLKALKELKRVLKLNGYLLITVPNFNFPFLWDPINWLLMKIFKTHINKDIWWLAGIWADHERLYSAETLKKIIWKTGFKIKKIEYGLQWCWPFSHFLLYGVGKNLVEKFNFKQFNRFEFKKKQGFYRLITLIFKIPSHFLDNLILKKSSSVNLLVTLKK